MYESYKDSGEILAWFCKIIIICINLVKILDYRFCQAFVGYSRKNKARFLDRYLSKIFCMKFLIDLAMLV